MLQPFAHSIADRSACLAIDPFADVGDSAAHNEFLLLSISWDAQGQVIGMEMVSARGAIAWLASKDCMTGGTGSN